MFGVGRLGTLSSTVEANLFVARVQRIWSLEHWNEWVGEGRAEQQSARNIAINRLMRAEQTNSKLHVVKSRAAALERDLRAVQVTNSII